MAFGALSLQNVPARILQEGLERYSWETQDPSLAQAPSEALGLPLFFSLEARFLCITLAVLELDL